MAALDARLINWKPPATVLDLDPIYRLERLSGRFSEIDRERTEIRTEHALSTEPLLEPFSKFLMCRDTVIAGPVNDAAREAVGSRGTAQE